jgi:hypothetical protein
MMALNQHRWQQKREKQSWNLYQGSMSVALASWSSGVVSACGVMGREVDSRLVIKGQSCNNYFDSFSAKKWNFFQNERFVY